MMLAYSRYQTEPLGKPTLLERCAYFIPRYATESLVKGRNAQEQRRIRHHVGEVTLVLTITLMPTQVYVPVGDSSHHQNLAPLSGVWGFSPLKLNYYPAQGTASQHSAK